jgi:hypothetical protein
MSLEKIISEVFFDINILKYDSMKIYIEIFHINLCKYRNIPYISVVINAND